MILRLLLKYMIEYEIINSRGLHNPLLRQSPVGHQYRMVQRVFRDPAVGPLHQIGIQGNDVHKVPESQLFLQYFKPDLPF